MIIFKNITIEGFGSIIRPLTFNLDYNGTTIINGYNGSGKTTLINSIVWCLYGTSLKGVNKLNLQTKKEYRFKDWRGTRVMLSFVKDGINYIVARHIKFKGDTLNYEGKDSLLIFKNNELIHDLYIQNSQETLNNIINIDFKVFINAVFFGQRLNRFISAKPAEKSEIFENIFRLEWITSAKNNAKLKQQEYTNKLDIIKVKIANLISTIDQDSLRLDQMLENKRLFDAHKRTLLKEKADKIHSLQDTIKNIKDRFLKNAERIKLLNVEKSKYLDILNNNSLEDLKLLHVELNKLIDERNNLDFQYIRVKKDLQFLIYPTKITEYCYTCGQRLDDNSIKDLKVNFNNLVIEYNTKKTELEKSLSVISSSKKNIDSKIHEINTAIESFKDIENIINDAHNNINRIEKLIITNTINDNDKVYLKSLEDSILEINLEINKITESTFEGDNVINSIKETLDNNINNVSKLQNDKEELSNYLEVVSWWFTIGFGNKGIKSYIIDSALIELNKAVIRYAEILGIDILFSIDIDKKSKPLEVNIFKSGVEYEYNQFSGGEKATIDVATAFALHDVVNNTLDINTVFMDEVFEGLDNTNMEYVSNMIKLKSENKSLFVITHSADLDILYSRQINIFKSDNNTQYE